MLSKSNVKWFECNNSLLFGSDVWELGQILGGKQDIRLSMLLIVQQIVFQQKIEIDAQAIGDLFAQIYTAIKEAINWMTVSAAAAVHLNQVPVLDFNLVVILFPFLRFRRAVPPSGSFGADWTAYRFDRIVFDKVFQYRDDWNFCR